MESEALKIPPRHSLSLKKRLFFSFVVTMTAGILALACAEIILRRTSSYITPEINKNRSLQYDPALFARHVFPQKELRPLGVEQLYKGEYYINARGYRGHDFSVPRRAGVIRIIFYGGSAAFDLNLPEGRDWPHRVETILQQNGYPEAEVINAGIPGHASFDCFGRLFSEGHLFNPDYVVSYNEWNDIKYFRSEQPLLREFKPHCVSFDPRLDYRNRLDRAFCEHSQLYVRLRLLYYNWRLRIGPQGSMPQGDRSSIITDTAQRQYYLNQVMFVDLAREIGAVPILMTEARLTMPENTESQKARIEPFLDTVKLDRNALFGAYDLIERTLSKISSEKNVDLIDAAKDLNGKDEMFADVVHLTPQGSEALAQATAKRLMEILGARNARDSGGHSVQSIVSDFAQP